MNKIARTWELRNDKFQVGRKNGGVDGRECAWTFTSAYTHLHVIYMYITINIYIYISMYAYT